MICPYCKETIQDGAIKCRYCGSLLNLDFANTINIDNIGSDCNNLPCRSGVSCRICRNSNKPCLPEVPMENVIRKQIENFVTNHPDNHLPDSDIPYFDQPLVGFSSASDRIFTDYKQIIGPFHLLPAELLAEAKSIISWVLPISRPIRESNRRETELPSREWALTRFHGEAINAALRRHMVGWLEEMGHKAVAPQYSPLWQEFSDTPVGIASTWSERHGAYAAGLGTFSLSDGFITERGIAHRTGSVITDLPLAPTPRTAPDHLYNCLYHRDGSCGACINRCPVDAITKAGHDKSRCRELVYGTSPHKLTEVYGVPQTGCGLCQTKVPCEAMIPPGKKL